MSDSGRMWISSVGGMFIVLDDVEFIWYNNYTHKFDVDNFTDWSLADLDPDWVEVV